MSFKPSSVHWYNRKYHLLCLSLKMAASVRFIRCDSSPFAAWCRCEFDVAVMMRLQTDEYFSLQNALTEDIEQSQRWLIVSRS